MTEEFIEWALKNSGGNITKNDAKLLIDACKQTNAKNILEIGAREGGSSLVFGKYAEQVNGKVYSLECSPKQKWFDNIKEAKLESYVQLIKCTSPWIDDSIKNQIPSIDVLFIDGNHMTRWCLVDYHFFSPFVKQNGIILFHDWCGANGIKEQIRRAVEIINETDNLKEMGRIEGPNRGCIAFWKK